MVRSWAQGYPSHTIPDGQLVLVERTMNMLLYDCSIQLVAVRKCRIREAPPTVPLIDSLELSCEAVANPRWQRRRRQDWCHA